ncbi:spore germination protein [Bacillus pakistanensis]|uniref:Spore germination protein n=1 Tax=Rossellomorea pakistanensis TaxID=992288 RepID=A0ABS2NEH8_9BACI|nr:Ger(x)C family spore germination protein [Bacillus pakistanensis]MBM7586159.1 spore germination protein [Bacillus pakistanensis]
MKRWAIILILTPILLNGCVQREILDDLNIETALGYDLVDENTIEGTGLFARYLSDKTTENVTISASAGSTREIFGKLEQRSQQPLVRGGLEAVLVGESLAHKGVINIGDSLQRDPSVGSRVYIAVVKGSSKELLNGEYGHRGNAIFISNLLEHNIRKRDVPETNLHLFLFNHFQEGQTAYLPMIRQLDEKNMEIAGVALFDKDKVVAEIPSEDMFYFKLLVDKYSEGSHIVKLNKKGKSTIGKKIEATINSLDSKNNIVIKNNGLPPKMEIKVKIKGIIKEYTGEKLSPKIITTIEKKMVKDIEKHGNKMINMFKEKKIDPLGIGQHLKHEVRGFDFKKWEASYPQADIKVKADVKIVESGTVE